MPEDIANEFGQPIKSAQRLSPVDSYLSGSWDSLGAGAPIMVALAQICSQAMVDQPKVSIDDLSAAAKAMLYMARTRGIFELKGANSAFEAPARLVAVYVEIDEQKTLAFRDRMNTETTAIFIEAFRQLCVNGLVLHHIHRDFSLTQSGFEMARKIEVTAEVQKWLDKATEFESTEFWLHE